MGDVVDIRYKTNDSDLNLDILEIESKYGVKFSTGEKDQLKRSAQADSFKYDRDITNVYTLFRRKIADEVGSDVSRELIDGLYKSAFEYAYRHGYIAGMRYGILAMKK